MNNIKKYYGRLKGSALACIGFFLSPLSWWNDPYVNIPIAYLCAWLVSMYKADLFLASFIGAYLATNVLGLVLLHKGIGRVLSDSEKEKIKYTGKALLKDIAISLLYTLIMVLLVKMKLIQPPQHYLK